MDRFLLALRTFLDLALPYFRSEDRWRARSLLAGVIVAELGLVYVAVAVIQWNARFFNALEARDWVSFKEELVIFSIITVGAIVAGTSQYFFGQSLLIRWRRWMTDNFIGLWMAEGRHYRIRFVDDTVDNIHLRIGNDVLLFVQRTHELGTGILGSLVSLASFAYILWGVSAATPLPLFGADLAFPGWLIVLALAYASLGTAIAHWIGSPLIGIQFRQQRFESDFRFAIARVTDHSEPVALMGGEAVERAELSHRFAALVRNWTALVHRQARLTGFIAGYGHVSTVFPILVVSPAYLTGAIQLGTLMQAHLAFQRVEGAFAFCISAYSKIAEWKAIMDRLAQFEAAMARVDTATLPHAAIDIATSAGATLEVDELVLRLANGEPIATVEGLTVDPGERVLVCGPSGSGKSSLFRALARLWPLGDGRIRLPRGARLLALPQRPYFPLGTLRTALAYPRLAAEVDDTELREAMAAAGLSHLTDRLDQEAEWSTVLSGGEQQRVAFARALLARPDVLMLDEAVTTLEDADGRELYLMLAARLPGTIVISTGRAHALGALHTRMVETSGAPAAIRAMRPALAAVPA